MAGFDFAGRHLPAVVPLLLLVTACGAFCAETDEIPKPKELELATKDGLRMRATYYGQSKGARAVPIVILHGYKGSRNGFDELARLLQKRGYAVIAPDLRGHGGSTKILLVDGMHERQIEAGRLRKPDCVRMVQYDMEAVRRFLVKKNNSEEVNLEKLCLIGAEMGASVALNWTAKDWTAPPLAVGKQGQDVKALVLVSPVRSFMGMSVQDALAVINKPPIRGKISTLVLVGKGDARALADANRIHKTMERWNPEPASGDGGKTTYFLSFDTSLQGAKLLRAAGQEPMQYISAFIERRCENRDYPWSKRFSAGQ